MVASTDVLDPGSTASLGVDFAPGEYVFTCRIVVEIPEGGLVDHYAEGMEATVTIKG